MELSRLVVNQNLSLKNLNFSLFTEDEDFGILLAALEGKVFIFQDVVCSMKLPLFGLIQIIINICLSRSLSNCLFSSS